MFCQHSDAIIQARTVSSKHKDCLQEKVIKVSLAVAGSLLYLPSLEPTKMVPIESMAGEEYTRPLVSKVQEFTPVSLS